MSGYIANLYSSTEGVNNLSPPQACSKKRSLSREDEYNLRALHGRVPRIHFRDRLMIERILKARTSWKPGCDDKVIQFDSIEPTILSPDRISELNHNPFQASPSEIKGLIQIAEGKRDAFIPAAYLSKVKEFAKANLQALGMYLSQLKGNALLARLQEVPRDLENQMRVFFPMQQGLFYARDWNNRLLTKFGSIQDARLLLPTGDKSGLITMLGFSSLDAFTNFITDKESIVDLGSGTNIFSKSLYLLGLKNTVCPINPLQRFLVSKDQAKDLKGNLSLSRRAVDSAGMKLKQIDANTIDKDWNTVSLPSDIALLVSTDAFPKFCTTREEAKRVLDKIYESLRPGGIAIFSPLYPVSEGGLYEDSPSRIDNFQSILRETKFQNVDVKALPSRYFKGHSCPCRVLVLKV